MASPEWDVADVIAERIDIPQKVSSNIVRMLDEGCTIPFIARYRKEKTGDIAIEKLREVYELSEELKSVQNKISTVKTSIEKLGKMTDSLLTCLRSAQSSTEVDHVYAPFKPGNKGTLAERARALGLEPLAEDVLKFSWKAESNIKSFVRPGEKGISTQAEVLTGIKNIIADIIHKDKDTMDFVRKCLAGGRVCIQTAEFKSKNKENKVKNTLKGKVKSEQKTQKFKFERYMDFQSPIQRLQPHQVMAINRGEDQKILSVKVIIPEAVKKAFQSHVNRKWSSGNDNFCRKIIDSCVEDTYSRLIHPQLCRNIRSDLTKNAEKASVGVFGSNLKNLLLTAPVKQKTVLGIDPGFTNGCKVAVISHTGSVLETSVLYLHSRQGQEKESSRLVKLIINYSCEIIAIGNGVGCRETETIVAQFIKKGLFSPLTVMYCIVDESGASIYSVSKEAASEMPELDHTLRGAVSIARRLQDPLSELVKIEPKHIGVGMYQHDISENQLKITLDSVVEECVSFVGVDLNTCSETLLRRVAGLSAARAKKILDWRKENGPFLNRKQLLLVKTFGEKTFEQCAGFVRIINQYSSSNSSTVFGQTVPHPLTYCPLSASCIADHVWRHSVDDISIIRQRTGGEFTTFSEMEDEEKKPAVIDKSRKRKAPASSGKKSKKKKTEIDDQPNRLDMTSIHPESYHITEQILNRMGTSLYDVGKEEFIATVENFKKSQSMSTLCEDLDTGLPTLELIFDALSKPLNYDIRDAFEKPLFKQDLTNINQLKVGSVLTGRVQNVTHFGAFVDIGVGESGLIHISKMKPHVMKGKQTLDIGDKVEVEVERLELQNKRIGLVLIKLL